MSFAFIYSWDLLKKKNLKEEKELLFFKIELFLSLQGMLIYLMEIKSKGQIIKLLVRHILYMNLN